MLYRSARLVWCLVLVLIGVLSWSPQASAINVQLFRPNIAEDGTLRLSGTKTLHQKDFAVGLYLNYARDPLVLKDTTTGAVAQKLANWVFTQDFLAEVGVHNRVTIGLDFPVHLIRHSPVTGGTTTSDDYVIGDLSLYSRISILNSDQAPLGLAFVPFIEVPTGKQDAFVGDESVNFGVKVVVDKKIQRFYANANVGYRGHGKNEFISQGATVISLDVDDELTYGVGAGFDIVPDRLQVLADFMGASTLKNFASKESSAPMELDMGLRSFFLNKNLIWNVGGGLGLRGGYGSPSYRVLSGVTLRVPHKEKSVEPTPPKVVHNEMKKIVLSGVNFVVNKHDLTPQAKIILDQNVAELNQDPKLYISIEGHTDSRGNDDYNQKLSEKRAESVLNYLHDKGISKAHMRAIGYGKVRPIVPNNSKVNYAKNRRVEIRLLTKFD